MKREVDLDSLLNCSIDNLVELPDGSKTYGDLKEFYRIVDFFASRYGMGGFKSIEEYAEMINQTDPVMITALYNAGVDAENKKWGMGDSDDEEAIKVKYMGTGRGKTQNRSEATHNADLTKPNSIPQKPRSSQKLRNLLSEFGVSKGELDKAEEKISRRKIELKDFSHVDKYSLRHMSQEEFAKLKQDFLEQNKNSVNIAVTDEMFRNKIREKRGK